MPPRRATRRPRSATPWPPSGARSWSTSHLVDEVIVIDDGSTDATAEAAAWEGALVYGSADILPDLPPGTGKGNALWKSLYVSSGDLVVWLDADVWNFGSHFVTRLLEPLLTDPAIGFVKGYYRRPLFGAPDGGGRVTELMARPVLSTLFPELTMFVQPLAGEYAGPAHAARVGAVRAGLGRGDRAAHRPRRAATAARSSPRPTSASREHRNRPLDQLSPQAMAVLLTALRRAGIPDERLSHTLVRYGVDKQMEAIQVETRERPPMLTIPAYRAKFGRELTA